MAIGFAGVRAPKCQKNDFFIAGNHDDAKACELIDGYLGDFGYKEVLGKKVFWIRGALSTDRFHPDGDRVEGVDWWAYEELNYQQLTAAVALYKTIRPDIVISHDCPKQMRKYFGERDGGITLDALSTMFDIHNPEFWVHGHHHVQMITKVEETHFFSLGELQEKKISTPKITTKRIKPST